MPWAESDNDEYEYCTLEWREIQEAEVSEKLRRLQADGWELDGPEGVRAGMFVDLYWQQLRRRKV